MAILVSNGQVWLEGRLQQVSILIDEGGKLAGIYSPEKVIAEQISETLDASGQIVLPGGLDMHAHLQDGAEMFHPGTCAAAAGGITTVVDMPPFHTCATRAGCLERRRLAEGECVVDFMLGGGIVVAVEDLEEIEAVAQFGAPYFKVFMPANPPVDTALLWASVQAAAHTGLRMAIHAEETACLLPEVNWDDPLGFAHARPVVAEASATAQVLEMALAAGAPVHITHVSAGRTAELIESYQAWGADVTAETTPHFLLLDESAFAEQGARVMTTPPLRRESDREILWQAIQDDVITALVSDHYLDKLPQPNMTVKSMRATEPGIAGAELSLPLLYDVGVVSGRISLQRFVELISRGPADILGIAGRKGTIRAGADADLVFLDPHADWTVSDLGPFSRASTLPYQGWGLHGRVTRTVVRGRTIWDGDEILAGRGYGRFMARGKLPL